MELEKLIILHQKSRYNIEDIKRVSRCACFYCKRVFNESDIKEYTDGGKTAICPYCGVDSVIPAEGDFVSKLDELHDFYF